MQIADGVRPMTDAQIFVVAVLFAAAGALLAFSGFACVFAIGLALCLYLTMLALGSKRRRACILVSSFFIFFCLAQWRSQNLFATADDLSNLRASYVTFVGHVISSKFKDADDKRSLTLEVESVRLIKPWAKKLSGKVMVQVGPYSLLPGSNSAYTVPAWGGTYVFRGRLTRPKAKLFPFEFDERRWLVLRNIFCRISCDVDSVTMPDATAQQAKLKPSFWLDATAASSRWCSQLSAQVRDAVVGGHCSAIGDQRGRLLASMVLGDRAVCLSDSLKAAFNRVGLSHLLAASGLNLTIIVGAVLFVLRGGGKDDRAGLWPTFGAFVCVLFFVSLAGSSPSVTRAMIMCLLLLWSNLLYRQLAIGAALSCALLIALVLDPLSILDVGLELSYGATFGIIYFVPLFERALPDRLKVKPWRWFASLTTVVVSAQLAVLPIQIYYFQKMSSLVLPANIMAEPLVAPITVAGFATSLGFALALFLQSMAGLCGHGPALLWLSQAFAGLSSGIFALSSGIDWLAGFLIDLLFYLTERLGQFGYSYLYLAKPQTWQTVVYVLALVAAFILGLSRPRAAAFLAIFAGSLLSLASFLGAPYLELFSGPFGAIVVSPYFKPFYIDAVEAAPEFKRGGHLPGFSRDFRQVYLRSLTARGFEEPAKVACLKDTLLDTAVLAGDSSLAGCFCSAVDPASITVTRVQDYRFVEISTWGFVCQWLRRNLYEHDCGNRPHRI